MIFVADLIACRLNLRLHGPMKWCVSVAPSLTTSYAIGVCDLWLEYKKF
jgi:hypothetical protein